MTPYDVAAGKLIEVAHEYDIDPSQVLELARDILWWSSAHPRVSAVVRATYNVVAELREQTRGNSANVQTIDLESAFRRATSEDAPSEVTHKVMLVVTAEVSGGSKLDATILARNFVNSLLSGITVPISVTNVTDIQSALADGTVKVVVR